MRTSLFVTLAALSAAALGPACSSSSSSDVPDGGTDTDGSATGDGAPAGDSGGPGDGGGGGDSGSQDAGNDRSETGGGMGVSGSLHDLLSAAAVSGATVSGGGQTATSDALGHFFLPTGVATPLSATITAASYTKLNGQEFSLTAPYDFGIVAMTQTTTTNFLTSSFTSPPYNSAKGLMAVQAVPTGGCASEQGATISVSPGGNKVVYFQGGQPSPTATSVTGGQTPSAIIYNVTPAVALTLTVSSPTCTMAAYPFTQAPITYTGAMQVEAGDAITGAKVFLR